MVMNQNDRLGAKLPPIRSSYVVRVGVVDEVTWTPEDEVVRLLGYGQSDYAFRAQLRQLGYQGIVTHRQHPEHAYHEYGPQWRSKDFKIMLEAGMAANMIRGARE